MKGNTPQDSPKDLIFCFFDSACVGQQPASGGGEVRGHEELRALKIALQESEVPRIGGGGGVSNEGTWKREETKVEDNRRSPVEGDVEHRRREALFVLS